VNKLVKVNHADETHAAAPSWDGRAIEMPTPGWLYPESNITIKMDVGHALGVAYSPEWRWEVFLNGHTAVEPALRYGWQQAGVFLIFASQNVSAWGLFSGHRYLLS